MSRKIHAARRALPRRGGTPRRDHWRALFDLSTVKSDGVTCTIDCTFIDIWPKYLGGDPKGPTVSIDPEYHQLITNAFRARWAYGQGAPSAAKAQQIMGEVYARYPLPAGR